VVAPPVPSGLPGRITAEAADLSSPGVPARLAAARPDVIFHLAAIVSGEAEVDFDKGYAVNLDATRALLEAVRATGTCPRVVFASSLAVFGPPFPARIPDDFAPQPATSYGAQKLMTELLVNDYTRRGMIDGLSLRLPTICVRPGAPNRAASGFFSGILREPLAGLPADLPVPETTRHYFASPRSAVGFFVHAGAMDTSGMDHRRALTMPGLSATVGEQIEALRAVAGESAVRLIRRTSDPLIERIVAGWGEDCAATRARELGFTAESDMGQILRAHIEDELGGHIGETTP
jgi:D-erythronate 2-dehydrogenase